MTMEIGWWRTERDKEQEYRAALQGYIDARDRARMWGKIFRITMAVALAIAAMLVVVAIS